MAHHEHHNENLSPEDKLYNKFITGGDGFFNIELFKSARDSYNEALKIRPTDDYATKRVAECTQNIARDTRKIMIVVPILAVIITTLLMVLR